MSTPRITQRQMVYNSLAAMQLSYSRLENSQEKLSTGRNINRPSDSPTGTNDAMRLRTQLASDTQYARNAQDGLGYMGTIDSTMTSMSEQVNRARELMIQGASTGSNGPDARQAIASELGQIRDSLLGLANTQYLGRPVFGGTTANAQAYDPSTGAFVGDTFDVNRTVGDGVSVKVNVAGPAALSNGADDLFSVLKDAITDMTTNPSNTGSNMARLDAITANMKAAHADIGTRFGRVETTLAALSSSTLDHQSALSDIENVDVAKAIVDVQMQQVAYQSALGATAKVIQPSLLDFLR
ncbi:MAG: flagellar hook-associated protein FlgL [Nocardioides sp.]